MVEILVPVAPVGTDNSVTHNARVALAPLKFTLTVIPEGGVIDPVNVSTKYPHNNNPATEAVIVGAVNVVPDWVVVEKTAD